MTAVGNKRTFRAAPCTEATRPNDSYESGTGQCGPVLVADGAVPGTSTFSDDCSTKLSSDARVGSYQSVDRRRGT